MQQHLRRTERQLQRRLFQLQLVRGEDDLLQGRPPPGVSLRAFVTDAPEKLFQPSLIFGSKGGDKPMVYELALTHKCHTRLTQEQTL